MVESDMNWAHNGPLQNIFRMPLDTKPAEQVVLDIGEIVLLFEKDDEVLHYYTRQDSDVFKIMWSEETGWAMYLLDENITWMPDDGCTWLFRANRMNSQTLLVEYSGNVEVVA
jgi:hypothetical protein